MSPLRHDYADRSWLKKYRRPLWQCVIKRVNERLVRTLRKAHGFDPLSRGISFRVENGLLFVVPTPARHRQAMPAETLQERLRIRARIRRTAKGRKSAEEGRPDRLADLLDEAAARIDELERRASPQK